MTPEEFAARLNGRQYGEEITKEEEAIAKDSGLVVCFGYSDDCLELRGAIYDELGTGDESTAFVVNGSLIDDEDLDTARCMFRRFGVPMPEPRKIEVRWCPQELNTSWLITSEGAIAFDIYEDEDLFCRGCVFKLD